MTDSGGEGGSGLSVVATEKTARLDKEDVKAIALEVFSMMKAAAKDNPAKAGKDGHDPPTALPEDTGRLTIRDSRVASTPFKESFFLS